MDNNNKQDTVTIGNCNLQSLTSPTKALLQLQLDKIKPTIFTLQDTRLGENYNPKLTNYSLLRKDRQNRKESGGLAIAVHKNNTFQKINSQINSTNEHLTAKIHLSATKYIHITTIYVHPGDFLDENLIRQLTIRYPRHIIAGDINAHLKEFGSTKNSPQGNRLKEIINTHHLVMLNSSHKIHNHPWGTELIDYVLATQDIGHKFIKFGIGEYIASDHIPTYTTLAIKTIQPDMPIKEILITRKMSTEEYHNEINKNLKPPATVLLNKIQIDEYIQHITTTIKQATDKSTPKVKIKYGTWKPSPSTMKLIRERRTLVKRKIRLKDRENITDAELNNKINSLQRKIAIYINLERQENWENLCTEEMQNENKDAHKFWKKFKQLTSTNTGITNHILNFNNKTAVSPQQKSEMQAEYYQKQMSPVEDNINLQHLQEVENFITANKDNFTIKELNSWHQIRPPEHQIVKKITAQDVKFTTKHLKHKSPGPDQIHNVALKNAPHKLNTYLSIIFNACIQIGYYPDVWKTSIIRPIPKPHKDPTLVKSYRPIALTSTIGKTFEKILNNRLRNFLEEIDIFNTDQCGFRKGRSTTDQLFKLCQITHETSRNRHKTLLLTIDIEAAFDKIWHKGLLYKLSKLNLPKEFIRLTNSYLTDRTIQVQNGDAISTAKTITASVPQGGVLSPTYFIIYVNDLPKGNWNTQVSQYADDIAIYTRSTNINTSAIYMRNYITNLEDWCSKWRISLNPEKSTLIEIGHKQSNPQILMKQKIIPYKKETKFLGLTISSSLTWGTHIRDIKTRCQNRLNLLRKIRGTNWGAPPQTIINTYKSLILPVIKYGYAAYCNIPEGHINQLQIIQNSALRIAYRTKWYEFTSKKELHEKANIPTVREVCLLEAKNYIKTRKEINTNPDIQNIINNFDPNRPQITTNRKSPLHILLE